MLYDDDGDDDDDGDGDGYNVKNKFFFDEINML